jgi:uncharacterized protein YxeA
MKNKMKKISSIFLAVILFASACVDDYTDANPKSGKDAPTLRISSAGTNETVISSPANRFQNNQNAYAIYNTPAQFTVSVVDAPGKIGTINVDSSVPEFGSVSIDESSVAAIQGSESGDFKFTFVPNPELSVDEDRTLNITVTVSDTQTDGDGEAAPKTTSLTMPLTIVNGPCLSEGVLEGYWMVNDASGNKDGGETFNLDSLKKHGKVNNVFVEITQERPGVYTINEVTGGVWPAFYAGRANPELQIDLCGSTITGRQGKVTTGEGTAAQRTFTINGTVNSTTSITINWSYVRDIGDPPPAPAAQGTYTITPL